MATHDRKLGLLSPPRRLFAGLIGLSLVNSLYLTTAPLIIGRFQDELHLTSSQVGTLMAQQSLFTALVGIALSTQLHRISARAFGIAACVAVVLANIWQAFAVSQAALTASAAIVGIGCGALLACYSAALATAVRVDRTAAMVTVGTTLLVAGLTSPVAHLAQASGRYGLFMAQAAIFLVAGLLTLALPNRHARESVHQALPLTAMLRSPVVLSFVGLSIGSGGVYYFTERIGVRLGLQTATIGDFLAGAAMMGIVGGACAVWLARPGREKFWAFTGLVLFGGATTLLSVAWDQAVYMVAIGAQAFCYMFTMPFLTALAIARDRSGGLAAAATSWSMLIGAGAPALAGYLVRGGVYQNLAWLAVGGAVMSCVALSFVRSDQTPPQDGSARVSPS
ncbi:MAG: MFS transporter [Phenylobacterium sp.]|nr:MFS transporter [Phenylobacterium sp.]